MDHRRSFSLAAILNRTTHHFERFDRISAVESLELQRWKILNELGNVANGSSHFDRKTDRITYVFQQKHQRQLQVGSRIERFPNLSFAARADAERNICNLVLMKTAAKLPKVHY